VLAANVPSESPNANHGYVAVLTWFVPFGPSASDANAEPVGALITFAAIVIVSEAACELIETVTGIVTVTPARAAGTVPTEITENAASAFADGAAATESIPKPNAETATSEMRLRSVFVDICFLSISRSREFPSVGFG
jgi:hypothetical protein